MSYIHSTRSTAARYVSRRILMSLVLLVSALWISASMAANTAEEERLDREAGILDRPWKINVTRLATRDYLRAQAHVKTGLPPYDQLVEGTRLAPKALLDKLKPQSSNTGAKSSSSKSSSTPTTPGPNIVPTTTGPSVIPTTPGPSVIPTTPGPSVVP
jgi:hypothetical protein